MFFLSCFQLAIYFSRAGKIFRYCKECCTQHECSYHPVRLLHFWSGVFFISLFFGDFETIKFCYSVEFWCESRFVRYCHYSRAASSSLFLLSFSFIASWIPILVCPLSSNTSSIFFNSLWKYCWSHSTISLSYCPLIIPFLCFLCNRIVSWW